MRVLNADELRKYKELLDDGIITESEFNIVKQRILNAIGCGIQEGNELSNEDELSDEDKVFTLQEILELDMFNTISSLFLDSKNTEKMINLLEQYISYKESIPSEVYVDVLQKIAKITDTQGKTILYEAMNYFEKNIIKELLNWGADANVKIEEKGHCITILDMACGLMVTEFGNEDAKQIYNMIKENGGKREYDFILDDVYKEFSTPDSLGEFFQAICQIFYPDSSKELYIEYSSDLSKSDSKDYRKAQINFHIPVNEKVFFIYDSTILHSLKQGFAICETGLYYMVKNEGRITWKEFQNYTNEQICQFLDKFSIVEEDKTKFLKILRYTYVSLYVGDLKLCQKEMNEKSEEYMFCAFCGKRISKTAIFCNYCGKKVKERG